MGDADRSLMQKEAGILSFSRCVCQREKMGSAVDCPASRPKRRVSHLSPQGRTDSTEPPRELFKCIRVWVLPLRDPDLTGLGWGWGYDNVFKLFR